MSAIMIGGALRTILEHVIKSKTANMLWGPGSSFNMNQLSSWFQKFLEAPWIATFQLLHLCSQAFLLKLGGNPSDSLHHGQSVSLLAIPWSQCPLASLQVCQTSAAPPSSALHRLEMPGTSLLLQAHWGHSH